jgi:succinate dehydrogenase/fumarate reductase cytochrome b subunit
MKNMSTFLIFIIAGVVLLGFGIWSLLAGKTIGLYGIIETRSSPFYWIIVIVLLGLGIFNIVAGLRILFRI